MATIDTGYGSSDEKPTGSRLIDPDFFPTVIGLEQDTTNKSKPVKLTLQFSPGMEKDWTGDTTPWSDAGYFTHVQLYTCPLVVNEAYLNWQSSKSGTVYSPANSYDGIGGFSGLGLERWMGTNLVSEYIPHEDPIPIEDLYGANKLVTGDGGNVKISTGRPTANDYQYQGQGLYYSAVGYIARLICIKNWDGKPDDLEPDTPDGKIVAIGEFGNQGANFFGLGIPSQDNFIILSSPDKFVNSNADDRPAIGAGTPDYELPTASVDMDKIELNLPIHIASIGSNTIKYPNGSVKWRNGLIHTWEDTPADGAFAGGKPYGFRFQYNPATWGQSVSFTEAINPDSIAKSNIDRLPLPGGFASISLKLYLNRIADLSSMGDIYTTGGFVGDLEKSIDIGVASGILKDKYDNPYNGNPNGFGIPSITQSTTTNLTKHMARIARQGTLYDLDYLYATANGATLGSYHVNYNTKNSNLTNPSYDNNFQSPDYGFIAPRFVRIWLGPFITFVGRINSISVQHLMFSQYMIPTFSEVQITLVRGLTFGKNLADSKDKYNNSYSTLGVVETASENNDTAGGTP